MSWLGIRHINKWGGLLGILCNLFCDCAWNHFSALSRESGNDMSSKPPTPSPLTSKYGQDHCLTRLPLKVGRLLFNNHLPPSQPNIVFSLLKKSRYTLITSVVDVWMYKPWNEHFSFVWNDKYKKSNSIANRVIPKKVFYRMLLNHQQRFLSKLSRIKSSQVTFMDKFGPRALNFG